MNGEANEIHADTHVSVLQINPCALKAIHLSLDGLSQCLGVLQRKMEYFTVSWCVSVVRPMLSCLLGLFFLSTCLIFSES